MIDIENINPIIKKLLDSIGIKTKKDIFDFFYQDIYSLSNPFEINEIGTFISRVKEAIDSEETILIYGDKDADGITATSVMYNTLKVVTKHVEAFVPTHATGYGLSSLVIEEYARSGVSLIITVDCGISNVEEVKLARELSIDIIITDHHDIPEVLPNAYAIYNPKLPKSGFNGIYFSGCAVAYKLMQALVFSYTKFFEVDFIVLDYEINKTENTLKYIKALKVKNFIISGDIFAFEKKDDGYKIMFDEYYDESISEEEVLEYLASYMFEGENITLVQTGGVERLKKLISLYEKYDLYLPEYEDVFNILTIAEKYTNINMSSIKTLKDFALSLNVNIYKYEELDFADMFIRADIFQRLFYLSQEKMTNFMKRESIPVALGTIADIIPLLNESRVYIKTGLSNLRLTNHIRYKTFLKKLNIGIDRNIDVLCVSWKIAPFINAAGRMGNPREAFNLLISEDEESASEFSDSMLAMNEARKALTEECLSVVTEIIEKNNLHENDIIIVKNKNINQGLTGLIAGRVLSKYNKTAIILFEHEELDLCIGSTRSTENNNVREMLGSLSNHLEKYGGHKNAAGFSLKTSKFEEFCKSVKDYANENNFDKITETKNYDLKIEFKDITLTLAENLELLEPFGCGNSEPIFASYNINLNKIERKEKDKKLHLMLKLTSDSKTLKGIIWNASEDNYNKLVNKKNIDIIYKIKVNRFNGQSDINLIIDKNSL